MQLNSRRTVTNFELAASEVFQVLRQYNYTVVMYDEDRDPTHEPEKARQFFCKPNNILVAIEDDNDNSKIVVNLGETCDIESMEGFLQTLRQTATKYNMLYGNERFGQEIQPKDFSTNATTAVREGKDYMTELTEQMYGTSRSSYLRLESARMIVRHSKKIVGEDVGARSRNIGSIFVENAQGERFLFPTNSLAGGRAMTQHVNQGGSWADQVGQQIQRMATDFQDLGQAANFAQANVDVLAEGAKIFERCKKCRKDTRKVFERLYREATYAAEAQRIEQAGEPPLVEGTVLENLRASLKVEGKKELPESVLNAVARAMNEGEGERAITEDSSDIGNISILHGQRVNKAAWEALKQGHLELVRPVEIPSERPANWERAVSGTPMMTVIEKAMWKLDFVVPLIKEPTLGNLMAWIDNQLEQMKGRQLNQTGRDLRTDMFKIVGAVLRAAKVDIDLKEGLGPRGVKAVLAFESWFDQFTPSRVLLENFGANEAQADDIEEVDELEEGVDLGQYDAKSSPNKRPGTYNVVDGSGKVISSGHDWTNGSREALKNPNHKLERTDEGDLIEDTELTHEDVVLPKKNQGADLLDDVMSKDPQSQAFAAAAPSMRVAENDDKLAAAFSRYVGGNVSESMGAEESVLNTSVRLV